MAWRWPDPAAQIARWARGRLQPSETCALEHRNIYILPTKAGWAFGATWLVMLLASVNYQLNLGYALTFVLGGAALVSMGQTHANLRRLRLKVREPQPVEAGEAVPLDIVIDNPGGERHAIGLGWLDRHGAGTAHTDVPALGQAVARLARPMPRRGLQPVPALRIDTHFPLGLFRAFAFWQPAGQVVVWPRAEQPAPPLPQPSDGLREGPSARAPAGGADFDGVRPYQRGDSLRQVAWKKVAASGGLVSRQLARTPPPALELGWQQAGPGDGEARLSRLAAWVRAAEAGGRPYGLEGPGLALPRGLGDAHQRAALRALAVWGAPTSGGNAAASERSDRT